MPRVRQDYFTWVMCVQRCSITCWPAPVAERSCYAWKIPMLFVAKTLEALMRPLGIQPPLHPRRMNFYRKSFAFSMDEALQAIGFAPKVDFPAGVAETARWYAEQSII